MASPSGGRLTSLNDLFTQVSPRVRLDRMEPGMLGISRFFKPGDFLKAMEYSPFIMACIHIRSSALAKFKLRAYTQTGKEVFGPAAYTNRQHPLYRLLERPNPVQNRYEFLYTVGMHLDILGNAVVLLDAVDGLKGLPDSLWPLDPSRVTPQFDAKGLSGYEYLLADGSKEIIPPGLVLHIKEPSPYNIYWGMGRVQYLSRDINIASAVTEFAAQFFNQGAQLSGILTTSVNLSDESFERLRAESKMLMTGQRNMHAMAVLDNGLQFQQLQASLKDIGVEGLDTMTMKRILTVMEVPGTKFGLYEFSTYKAADMERVFTDAMEARAELVAGGLNQLAGLYDKDGNAVPDDELQAIRNGRVFKGKYKGISLEFLLPSKDTLADQVATAGAIAINPKLTDEEARNAVLNILGNLVTAPSGTVSGDLKPSQLNQSAPQNKPVQATPAAVPAPMPKETPRKVADTLAADKGDPQAKKPAEKKSRGRKKKEIKAGNTGVMVGFFLDKNCPEIGKTLELLSTSGAGFPILSLEGLHLTLAYVGDSSQLNQDDKVYLLETVRDWAMENKPACGTLSGLGRFNNDEGAETNAVYVSVDSKDLGNLREELDEEFEDAGITLNTTHGFTAHITLGYIGIDEATPNIKIPALPFCFDTVTLAWGDEHYDFKLMGMPEMDEDAND